jgi:hypothetical protein
MKRHTHKLTLCAVAALTVCSTFSTGCEPLNWFGTGFSLNFVVPLGLAGTPGLLNPFGIVQAVVNTALGLTSSGSSSSAYTTPASSTNPPAIYVPGIGTVIQ